MALTTSRQMLVRLEFSASATNDIYQRQGIEFIDEWENFDKGDVFSLRRLVLQPGDGGNGEMVSFTAELNLQLAVFFIHHKIRTSRTVDYGDINVTAIFSLKKQQEKEAIKYPKTEASTIDLKDVLKTYKSLIQYLCGMRGGTGVLLSYVVRESNTLHPKPSVYDPVTASATHDEETVKRALIITAGNPLGT